MQVYPELPYRFIIMTLFGMSSIDFPETQWDAPAKAEVSGHGAAVVKAYVDEHGIGFRGHLFTLDAVSPQDMYHALTMNETTHHMPSIRSFDAIGYVPTENLSDEDMVDDDSEDVDSDDDDPLAGFDIAMDEERLESIMEAAATDDWKSLKQLFEGPEVGNRFGDGLGIDKM